MTSRERLLITPTLLLAVTLATSLVAAPVMAASPHFIGTPTIGKAGKGGLAASFKVAGLGLELTGAFLTSSGGTALLQCVNPAGNNPPPKEVTFGPLQGQITFFTPRNGQITAVGLFMAPPPLPTASQICPNSDWSVQLVSITYLNVILHIQQNGGRGADILSFNWGTVTHKCRTLTYL